MAAPRKTIHAMKIGRTTPVRLNVVACQFPQDDSLWSFIAKCTINPWPGKTIQYSCTWVHAIWRNGWSRIGVRSAYWFISYRPNRRPKNCPTGSWPLFETTAHASLLAAHFRFRTPAVANGILDL